MNRSRTGALGILTVAAALILVVGCGDDTTAPYAWAGTYTTAVKWGGAAGVWNPSADLVVTSATDIRFNSVAIINPTWVGNALSWTIDDGNAANANITFKTSSSNAYYWTSPVEGQLFEGSYQDPGSGAVDFRGIVE